MAFSYLRTHIHTYIYIETFLSLGASVATDIEQRPPYSSVTSVTIVAIGVYAHQSIVGHSGHR